MLDENLVVGQWSRVKVLGCGGFGQVSLWQRKSSSEYVAVKTLLENDPKDRVQEKKMERWCKEVEIMNKLNHVNIVRALKIPELASISRSPILAMEYCGLGDLRQVLSKPENCCGLSESTVINILRDISCGLEYLHSCKVIHRDLKPDNIVLQGKESDVVYKLIDLGYAKELDQNSVCKSFVGTIQYLAPELFLGKLYSSSVDYWSFGLVAHEIITGYRPFLPGSNPHEWMKQVQNKPRNTISVIESVSGEIIFSSTISRINHVSRCFLLDMEKWLQLALDWNGDIRGKDLETNKLAIFTALQGILSKKKVKIFSLPTYEILCYELKTDTDVTTLKLWLCRDTGIRPDEQILLLQSGKSLAGSDIVINLLSNQKGEPDEVAIFLFNCGSIKIKSRVVQKPLYVKELLEDPKKPLRYKHLRRSCSDSIFFLQSELKLYKCLMEAVKLKVKSIQTRQESVEGFYEDVAEEWKTVESYEQFLILSHKADLENYIQLRKEGVLQASELVKKWIAKVSDVEKKLNELGSISNKFKLKKAIEEAKEKCRGLENNEFVKSNDETVLNELLSEGLRVCENVQKIPKENRTILKSNTEMVKILYRCIEYTTKLLRSPLLDLVSLQLSEAEEHLSKLMSPLTIWMKSTKIIAQIIENTQKERQKEIWGLIPQQKTHLIEKGETAIVKTEEAPEARKEQQSQDNNFSPFHIPKTVQNDVQSPVEDVLKLNFQIMEPVSVVPNHSYLQSIQSPLQYSMMRSLETDSIINTNNYLRHRVQEMNNSWQTLMEEVNSLDWESLKN